MDAIHRNTSGKTFRRNTRRKTEDSLLWIDFKRPENDSVELFDDINLFPNVAYSSKKKGRWMLCEFLSKDKYDCDTPILYCKNLSEISETTRKSLYLFDSITDKEFGSLNSLRNKNKKVYFNGNSVMRTIDNQFNYTKPKIEILENSKIPSNEIKNKFRKNRSGSDSKIPEKCEALSIKEEHSLNMESREDCVYINEYIRLNDLSQKSKIDRKRLKASSTKVVNAKSLKRNITKNNYLNKDDENYEIENDEENDEEWELENINNNVKEMDTETMRKPFSLYENGLLPNYKLNKKKSRHRKKQNRFSEIFSEVQTSPNNITDTLTLEFVELYGDILPSLVLHFPLEAFVYNIKNIVKDYQCWFNENSPQSILIDLNNEINLEKMKFLIIKPRKEIDSNNVTVTVIFNMEECYFQELSKQKLTNLTELVQMLQSKFQTNNDMKYFPKLELLRIDEQMIKMEGVWKTKSIDNQTGIYQYCNHWKNYRLMQNDVDGLIIKLESERNSLMEKCDCCTLEYANNGVIKMSKCHHKVCEECVKYYLIYSIENGKKHLYCPGVECQTEIDCVIILSLLSWERYYKWFVNMEFTFLQDIGTSCINCGALTLKCNDEFPKKFHYICSCNYIVCNLCGGKEHWPSSCFEMQKHNKKLMALKDVETFSNNYTPLIFKGISCPNCSFFICRDGKSNDITCPCGNKLCYICGYSCDNGEHKVSGFPCLSQESKILQTFDLTFYKPNPTQNRPKLYIMSVEQRVNSLRIKTQQMFKNIEKIFHFTLASNLPHFEVEIFKNQFVQLINVTEGLLVKSYQLDRKNQSTLYNYLKNSAFTLMFYQNQIKLCIENICYYMDQKCGANKNMKLKINCEKLFNLLSEVKQHIYHMHSVLQI